MRLFVITVTVAATAFAALAAAGGALGNPYVELAVPAVPAATAAGGCTPAGPV